MNVKQPLTPPTLTATTVYDCDGIARVNMTTNKAGYSYYTSNATTLPTVAPNTGYTTTNVPSATFPAGTTGNKTVRVFYKETTPPDLNILIQEDFGEGKPVCHIEGVPAAWGCSTADNNHYISGYNNAYLDANPVWRTPYDHTTNNPSTEGRFAFFNIGNVGGMGSGGIMYYKDVNNVEPNQPIKFKLYLFDVVKINHGVRPNVEIRLVSGGTTIASQVSGNISPNTSRTDWREFSGELNPGTHTSFRIEIRSIAV